jgi:hypothetical protein
MESDEQKALFAWAAINRGKHPELELLYHVPNGGSRHPAEAANLKAQGVKAGVPDICLPVPRGAFHGLYIEMKYGKNKLTVDQKWWLVALSQQGYATAVCYTWESARTVILSYLGGG